MDLPAIVYTLRWFLRDTFRQALASRLSGLMLGASGVVIAVCLSVGVDGGILLERDGERVDFLPAHDPFAEKARNGPGGVDVVSGELTVFFGKIHIPLGRDVRDTVHFLELLLAGGVADSLGVLLALVWTASFLPSFLQPSEVAVLLAKPTPRWVLLAGKYLGVLAFVAFQAAVFMGGTWMALGLRTGVWDMVYLLCVPLLVLHFAIFFGVSVLLAVCTRQPMVCICGSLLFWFLCWGMNYGRHAAVVAPDSAATSAVLGTAVEAGYWALPKPADLGMVLFDTLHASDSFQRPAALQAVDNRGAFHPLLSMLTSLVFTLLMLAASAWRFAVTDY
jgi:hypothetical protein